jgi:hypothetical protein
VGCVTITRPDPLRRLWYAYGGGLAPRYREWVLFDATCRTWLYESVEHRVWKAGFPRGSAQAKRDEATSNERAAAAARHAARYRGTHL